MASSIDATKPTEGTATTQSVRDNFSAAKTEIEALQTGKQNQSTILDNTTASYTTSEQTKLSGIESSADVTDAQNIGTSINGATAKTTPVNADTIPLIDSAASNVLKKVSWSNIKATIKAYFDTLYQTLNARLTDISGLTPNDGNFIVGDGSNYVSESGVTARASLGVNDTNANILINGDGMLNQAGAGSGIADDAYDFDQWYSLTQTGTIAVSQQTGVADGTPFMMRMTQSQATAQRMGRAQIIEGKNCKWLRGQQITLSLKHKISSAANLRIAVLEWTGTEDSVTSDVVNSWTSSTYTAGNFFNTTTLTVTGVSPAIASTTSLATDSLTVTLGSSLNNLIVMVWTEAATAQNVTLDLALKLEKGGTTTAFDKRSLQQELELAQRYYTVMTTVRYTTIKATSQQFVSIPFPTRMRATPTITTSNFVDTDSSGGSITAVTAVDWGIVSISNSVTTVDKRYQFTATASARL